MADDPSGTAWDCHAHVIGDPLRYPLAPGRGYDPPRAPLEDYLEVLDRLGIARGVLIQPSVYGFDNRCLLDALDEAGGRLLGVVVPSPDTTAAALRTMHERGVRGIRCNLINPGGLEPEVVLEWEPVMQELGWHVAFHVDVERIPDPAAYFGRFSVDVVVDHMGRPHAESRPKSDARSGADWEISPSSPGFQRLVGSVRDGSCYVKLSAPYRLSGDGAPWADVTPLAQALLEANPERCLWATDWPHTDTDERIDDEELRRALTEWCPDEAIWIRVSEKNPGGLMREDAPD